MPVKYDLKTDFAVLCSNCHRTIHRHRDPSDLVSFRALIKRSDSVRCAFNSGSKADVDLGPLCASSEPNREPFSFNCLGSDLNPLE